MSLYDRAKADIERITSNKNEWGLELTFTAPDNTIAVIAGTHAKHWLSVSTEGQPVSSKTAHVAFSEKFLTDAAYPVRNAKGHVDLVGHRIDVKDSTGIIKNYQVASGGCYPDETIGLIVCLLEFFKV